MINPNIPNYPNNNPNESDFSNNYNYSEISNTGNNEKVNLKMLEKRIHQLENQIKHSKIFFTN